MIAAVRISEGAPRGWLLTLRGSGGNVGHGEAITWPGFGTARALAHEAARARVRANLEVLAEALLGCPLAEAEDRVGRLDLTPEAAHAADLALLALRAAQAGHSVAEELAPRPLAAVEAHALVSGPEEAIRAVDEGARALKTKLPPAAIPAIRAAVGPDVRLRVDANAGWDAERARRHLEELAALDVEWVEQPVPGLRELAGLRGRGVPIAADEAVAGADLAALLECADVVVVKPMFLGGPRPALELARSVERAGGVACVTSALESPVGRLGALHVAAALGRPERIHGVGGGSMPAGGRLELHP